MDRVRQSEISNLEKIKCDGAVGRKSKSIKAPIQKPNAKNLECKKSRQQIKPKINKKQCDKDILANSNESFSEIIDDDTIDGPEGDYSNDDNVSNSKYRAKLRKIKPTDNFNEYSNQTSKFYRKNSGTVKNSENGISQKQYRSKYTKKNLDEINESSSRQKVPEFSNSVLSNSQTKTKNKSGNSLYIRHINNSILNNGSSGQKLAKNSNQILKNVNRLNKEENPDKSIVIINSSQKYIPIVINDLQVNITGGNQNSNKLNANKSANYQSQSNQKFTYKNNKKKRNESANKETIIRETIIKETIIKDKEPKYSDFQPNQDLYRTQDEFENHTNKYKFFALLTSGEVSDLAIAACTERERLFSIIAKLDMFVYTARHFFENEVPFCTKYPERYYGYNGKKTEQTKKPVNTSKQHLIVEPMKSKFSNAENIKEVMYHIQQKPIKGIFSKYSKSINIGGCETGHVHSKNVLHNIIRNSSRAVVGGKKQCQIKQDIDSYMKINNNNVTNGDRNMQSSDDVFATKIYYNKDNQIDCKKTEQLLFQDSAKKNSLGNSQNNHRQQQQSLQVHKSSRNNVVSNMILDLKNPTSDNLIEYQLSMDLSPRESNIGNSKEFSGDCNPRPASYRIVKNGRDFSKSNSVIQPDSDIIRSTSTNNSVNKEKKKHNIFQQVAQYDQSQNDSIILNTYNKQQLNPKNSNKRNPKNKPEFIRRHTISINSHDITNNKIKRNPSPYDINLQKIDDRNSDRFAVGDNQSFVKDNSKKKLGKDKCEPADINVNNNLFG